MSGDLKAALEARLAKAKDPVEIRARFMKYVERRQSSACWWWIGDRQGEYGRFSMVAGEEQQSTVFFAHRASYMLFVGPIPDELLALHTCDHKLCVNPAHLVPGTHAKNMQEAVERGRMRPWNSKIDDATVAAIRQEYRKRDGELPRLSEKYGVSIGVLFNIVHGHNWKRAAAFPVYEAPKQSAQMNFFEKRVDPKASVSTKRPQGATHHKAKLTAELVRAMRAEAAAGVKGIDLAEKYGIGKAQVSAILRREFWKNV
jgi:hypothetical protein